jgi:hypothetical protein
MADAFGGPTADGVDDVDKAVEGIKANWTAKKGYGAIELKHRTFRITLHPN